MFSRDSRMNILHSTAGFTKHECGNISIRFVNLSVFLIVKGMANWKYE